MANYKVVDADQLDADLASVADSIRAKAGTSGQIAFPDGFKSVVDGIQTGGATDALWHWWKGTVNINEIP